MKRAIVTAAAVLALSGGAATAQDAPAALSIDDSLICAGLFFVKSTLPEYADQPGAHRTYREVTDVFLDRAEILAAREGKGVEGHSDRFADVAGALAGMIDAAPDAAGRQAVIFEWQELEDLCIEGGQTPA